IYTVGTRSFSIFNADNRTLVYDSKDDFEQITSKDTTWSKVFNADNEGNGAKGRSRAKGPEPEGVCLASINGRLYSFVTLERTGGVMAYNITDPSAPSFVDYNNTRNQYKYDGDNGPEGIIYIHAKQSPDNQRYILVANELSGTITVYQLKVNTTNVDLTETNVEDKLSVYPNPNNGNVLNLTEAVKAEIIDISGKVVLTFEGTQADITSLENGLYFIRLENGQTLSVVVLR
ncbi:MAG TPA: T9SS type A sorting domain-containing protein, partial [Bacteroidia bacterium]